MEKMVDNFTEIVDITLYKYNSIDLKLWGLMNRDANSKRISDQQVLVSRSRLEQYLDHMFHDEINRFNAVSDVNIHREATSAYFIWKMFNTMPNLRYVRVNLNRNSSYNRIINVDNIKTIKYDIKSLRGSLRLFDIFNQFELDLANMVLMKAGLLEYMEKFKVFKLQEFLSSLDLYQHENNNVETASITNAFINRLEAYESDNPEMLLITDWDSDI